MRYWSEEYQDWVQYDYDLEQEAYDQLPDWLRKAVRESPYPFSRYAIQQMLNMPYPPVMLRAIVTKFLQSVQPGAAGHPNVYGPTHPEAVGPPLATCSARVAGTLPPRKAPRLPKRRGAS